MDENNAEHDDPMNVAAIATETSQGNAEEASGSNSQLNSQFLSQLTAVTGSDSRRKESQDEKQEDSMLQHRENANEIFETFFQRVFQRSHGNPISHKRFMRAIEKAKSEMGFSVEEEQ